MKKVLSIVLNNFVNDSRVFKEAQSLTKAGYQVQVVALHEGELLEFEKVQGVEVHRIKLKTRSLPKWKVIQVIKYLELFFSILKRYRTYDVYHCHDLNPLLIGVVIKKYFNRRAKIVYDAHEYETETDLTEGVYKKLLKFIERKLITYADAVITVSDSIASEYQRLYGIEKPVVLFNTPPYQKVKRSDYFRKKFHIPSDHLIFLYQGGLSPARGLEILLEVFSQLGEKSKKTIIFMGYGPLEGLVQDYASRYRNIKFHAAVAPDVLLNYTAAADVGILFYENTCLNNYYCLPNKLFEYLMASLPVLVSDLYELRHFVTHYGVGVVAKSNDVVGFREALSEFTRAKITKWSANTQRVRQEYNWEIQEKKLIEIYYRL